MIEADDENNHWDDEDELKWLESMNIKGKLNARGKSNLAYARKLKASNAD